MKRNSKNLKKYKKTIEQVFDRAYGVCEIIEDGKRCTRRFNLDQIQYINLLHKDTRNGKSDDWILNPDNIVLGCKEHHINEEMNGGRVDYVTYDEDINYIPYE